MAATHIRMTTRTAALGIVAFVMFILVAVWGGYNIGKDAALRDNTRDQILRTQEN